MKYQTYRSLIQELSEEEGVFTTAQAERFGIPRSALSYASSTHMLERVAHGAYRLVGAQTGPLDGAKAAWSLTAPGKMTVERMAAESWDGVAIGGGSAAAIQGLGDFHLTPLRVLSPVRFNSRRDGVCFGTRVIEREDVSFSEGFALTKPERTMLDLILDKEDPSQIIAALKDARGGHFDLRRFALLLGREFGVEEGADLAARFVIASEEGR